MAEYRDPTLAPGTTPPRTTSTTPNVPVQKAGMSRWIWIIAAVVVALVVLFMLFGGTDEAVEGTAGGDATVTEPAAPTTDPATPAPAPVD